MEKKDRLKTFRHARNCFKTVIYRLYFCFIVALRKKAWIWIMDFVCEFFSLQGTVHPKMKIVSIFSPSMSFVLLSAKNKIGPHCLNIDGV